MNASSITRIKPELSVETRVSRYDTLNAVLVALIMIVGFLVSVLFLIWLTTAYDFSSSKTAINIDEFDEQGDEKPEGVADDILEPGVEEFPEVETPQLAVALEAVSEAISTVRSSLEERSGDAAKMGKGSGLGSRDGGPGTGGGAVPEYKRWIIQYEADSLSTYAKQLSYFNIDIGVVHKTNQKIWRVSHLEKNPALTLTSRSAESKSLRFMHKKQRMIRWDRTLASRAGAPLDNTITCHFYPESTRKIIRIAEAKALEGTGRSVVDLRNTILKLESTESGYVFTVIELLYR